MFLQETARTSASAVDKVTHNNAYTLLAPDFDSLAEWGPKVLDRLSRLPEIADVSSDQQNSGLSSQRGY